MNEGNVTSLMRRFNDAFLAHDPVALVDLVADDCIVENTTPAPDGARYEGKAACLHLWQGIASSSASVFEPEDVSVFGDRAIIRWRLRWGPGPTSSVRGVNLMRVRDGLIVEALGYVKS